MKTLGKVVFAYLLTTFLIGLPLLVLVGGYHLILWMHWYSDHCW